MVYCKNDDNKENKMENVKYEAVFGDQSLFDGASYSRDDLDI